MSRSNGRCITDLADNVFTLWRNKAKERASSNAREVNADVPDDVLKRPDSVLFCSKQRNGEWEGSLGLWWRNASYQFVDWENAKPVQYVDYSVCDSEEESVVEQET